jgi:outer membrane biosynthesis protein TonB
MWGPVLGWCVLELLAESIDAQHPEQAGLDLFDTLRLREPLGHALGALGFEGEEGWRVAGRVKVLLLTGAGVGQLQEPAETELAVKREESEGGIVLPEPEGRAAKPEAKPTETQVEVPPGLWLDPDVRWLTGAHEAGGHSYLVREPYEELLWWLLTPTLLHLAGKPVLDRAGIAAAGKSVDDALAKAEAAGYRIDLLSGITPAHTEVVEPKAEPVEESAATGAERAKPEKPEPQKPEPKQTKPESSSADELASDPETFETQQVSGGDGADLPE